MNNNYLQVNTLMLSKQKTLIVLMLLTASLVANSQEKMKLSLAKALELGMQSNSTLSVSNAKIKAAKAKVNEVSTLGLPSLKFAGSYNRLSNVDEFKVNGFSIFPVLLNQTNLQLNLVQPIYTGNKISASKDAAEHIAKASEIEYSKDRTETSFAIKNAYWNLKKAVKFRALADENVAQMQLHLQEIKNLAKNGMVTDNDVLKVEVALNDALLRQMDAQNAVQMATVVINNGLGLSLTTELDLETEPNTNTKDKGQLITLIDKAIKIRPEINSNEYRIKAAESNIEATKGAYYPQISVGGNFTYANPNQRWIPNRDEFRSTWAVGVNVSYDIWNWNATGYQVEQSEAQLMQAKDGMNQLKDAIVLELTQNYLSYNQAIRKISIAETGAKQAEENLRVTMQKFKNGAALSSDVTDAEVALLQAKTNHIQAQIDFEVIAAKLDKSIGE